MHWTFADLDSKWDVAKIINSIHVFYGDMICTFEASVLVLQVSK